MLIGYSLNDPNVKQILSWLKNSGNSMPIYLIKTEETKEEKEAKGFDLTDFQYYDKKGVKLLYLSEIYEEKTHKEQLRRLFKFISAENDGFNLSHDEMSNNYNMLMYFDLKKMKDEIEKIKDHKKENDILLKSFLLYCTLQDIKSYEILKELSESACKSANYAIWYLSMFNRKHFVFHLGGDTENHDKKQEKINVYLEDIRKIALEDKYQQLPQNVRDDLRPFTILENNLDKERLEAYRLLNAMRNDFDIRKNGGFSGNNNVQKILEIFEKACNEMIGLCLLHRGYDELYTNIMECLLIAKGLEFLGIDEEDERKDKVVVMPLEIFSHSIRYFKTKDLQEIMGQYLQKRYFVFEKQEIIKEIFTNICAVFNHFGAFTSYYSRWFNNFLIMSAHVKLNQAIFDFIIQAFCKKMSDGAISFNEYEYLEYFIVSQCDLDDMDSKSALMSILQEYMRKISSGKFSGYDILLQTNSFIFKNIFAIFKKKQYQLTDENKNIVTGFIESIHLDGIRKTFFGFIAGLFHNSDAALQASMKAVLREKIYGADTDETKKLAKEFCELLIELGIFSEKDCECLEPKNK